MRERVVLDVAGAVAQRLELGQALGGGGARGDEIAGDVERALQPRVAQRLVDIFLEARRGRQRRSSRRLASPIGGSSVMPASTSATWRTRTCRPSRCIFPAMFIRQPRSPASSVSAPRGGDSALFLATMASDSSPYLTANVPPKPQQTSLSCELDKLQPLDASPAACAAARARQARAGRSRNRDRSRRLRSALRPWSSPSVSTRKLTSSRHLAAKATASRNASGSSANSSG